MSARTGLGLDALRSALDRVAGTAGSRPSDGPARLPVDRSFSLRGIGTVVTGTLWTAASSRRPARRPAGGTQRCACEASRCTTSQPSRPRPDSGSRWRSWASSEARSTAATSSRVPAPSRSPTGSVRRTGARVCATRPSKQRASDGAPRHRRASRPGRDAGRRRACAGCRRPGELRLRSRAVAAPGDHVVIRLTRPAITLARGDYRGPDPRGAPGSAEARPRPAGLRRRAAAALPRSAAPVRRRRSPRRRSAPRRAALAHLVAAGRAVRAGRDLAFTAGRSRSPSRRWWSWPARTSG